MTEIVKRITIKIFSKKFHPFRSGWWLSSEIKYPIFGFIVAVTIFLTFAAFKDYLKALNSINKNQIPSPSFSFLQEKGVSTFLIDPKDLAQVLGEFEDVKAAEDATIFFNLQSRFTEPAFFEENITAPNVVYEITAGDGIVITGDPQFPVISSTAISTVQTSALDSIEGLTGTVDLKAGSNISISTSGNEITINSTLSEITDSNTTYTAGTDLDLTETTFSLETTLDSVTTINNLTTIGDGTNTFLGIGDSGTTANFNFNNNQVYIRGDGRVGIGTSTPGYTLDVAGNIRAGTELYIGSIGLGDTGSGVSGATLIGTFDEFTNSDGTNVQDVLVDLDSAIGVAAGDAITAVGNITSGSAFTQGVPGSELCFTDDGFLGIGSTNARIVFDNVAGANEINLLGANVGIGSTTPSALLSVGSSNQFTVDTTGAIKGATIDTGDVDGAFEIRYASNTEYGLASFTAPHFDVTSTGVVSIKEDAITATELNETGITASTYGAVLSGGTSGFYPILTVDADGRLTSASTVPFTFESPLSFSNGLTRTTNSISLGGQITGDTRLYTGSGTEVFFIQQATGEIGIGTTNPSYKLDVAGSIRAGTEIYIGSIGLGDTGSGVSGATLIGTFDEFTNSDGTNVQDVLVDLDSAIGVAAGDAITAVGNITSGSAFTQGVPGSELYFTDDGFLGIGSTNARIVFDNVAGANEINLLGANVGIGSTTPSALLSVGSSNQFTVDTTGAIKGATIDTGDVDGAFEIRYASNTEYGLASFTAPHFDVTSTGVVSIKEDAITATELNETGITASTYGAILSGGTSGFYPILTVDADGRLTSASTVPFTFESPLSFSNGLTRTTNSISLGGQITGDTRLYTGSGTEVFFIQQATGEIGIGTTNPSYKLDVAGSIRAGTEIYIGSIGLGDTGSGVSGATLIGT